MLLSFGDFYDHANYLHQSFAQTSLENGHENLSNVGITAFLPAKHFGKLVLLSLIIISFPYAFQENVSYD